jgi:hypothetical protein
MKLKDKFLLSIAFVACLLMLSCGCKSDPKAEVPQEQEEQPNAFSAEALADLVEYERQKEGEGTEYNPWQSYGLKEMVDFDDADDSDFEYQDEDGAEVEETEGEIPDGDENYVGDPLIYYLGYHVDFNSSKTDMSAFSKQEDDGVGVIDRFDDKGSRIDILVYDKKLYDDFVQKSKDQVRYTKVDDSTYVSKDSVGRDVNICFAGAAHGGYQISILTK